MTFHEFHNGLRLLASIDRHEIEESVGAELTDAAWVRFRDNPWRFFIRCSDITAEAIWQVMEKRTRCADASLGMKEADVT